MATWTQQMGYPVIEVTRVSDSSYRLTQRRFLSNPKNEGQPTLPSAFE